MTNHADSLTLPAGTYVDNYDDVIIMDTKCSDLDRFRARKQLAVCKAIVSTGGNIPRACEIAGIASHTFYMWRHLDPEFDRLVSGAFELSTDTLEGEAIRRAVDGVERPVFYRGKVVGHTAEYSDRLLELLLVGRKPQIYGRTVTINRGVDHAPHVIDAMQAAEASALSYEPTEAVPHGRPADAAGGDARQADGERS